MTFNPEATITEEAVQAESAVGGVAGFGQKLLLLIQPTVDTPDNHMGDGVAGVIGLLLGPDAETSKLTGSFALCVDTVFPGSSGFGMPPIAHLGWSGFKFWRLKRARRDPKTEPQPGAPIKPGP